MGVNSSGTTLIDNGTFKNIGAITWDTTAKTGNFTAVGGNGYFVNTTSASITVTLPASPSAGDVVGIADYANTADTNKISIGRNGSNIQGLAADFDIVEEGGTIILVYVDGTQGWLSIDAAQSNDIAGLSIEATGGTITTSGDYKIHTFTGPGTFTVTRLGQPTNTVDYLVIAGGGSGGGREVGGGGGAGGYRESSGAASGGYPASPLGACVSALPVTATGYPITVGGGGSGTANSGNQGSNSVFSSITSTGGGYGAVGSLPGGGGNGGPGGSGGGGGRWGPGAGGSGNTPPVSPSQGNNGGTRYQFPFSNHPAPHGGGGGGGAGSLGGNASSTKGGNGGCGATTSISGSAVIRAGGGGGGTEGAPLGGGDGGPGGGGAGLTGGSPGISGNPGTVNTGGGGGGTGWGPSFSGNGGAGGSGIVIIRYKFQ